MKKLFALLAALTTLVAANAQQPLSLSLDEAINYALQNQPAYQNYKIDQRIATSKNLESTSKYLPKVNGSYDMRDNLKLGQIALQFPNPVTGQDEERTIQQGTKYSASAGVDLTQPILDMGAVSDIQYSKQQQQLTDLRLQQATIDLKLNVTRAYYLVLLNKERVNKAAKSVERAQRAYGDTKVRFDNQNALKTDVSRTYLNLQNAQYQLKVAADSVKTGLTYLAQLIGLPDNTPIELTGTLPNATQAPQLPEYPDFATAERNRVELLAENTQLQLNKLQLKKINYQYIPNISGYAFIGGQGLSNDQLFVKDKWFWSSYIGLRVGIPIFDGLQKVSLSQQQKLTLAKSENNIASLKSNIRYQLQMAAINYANAAQNLNLIRENVQLAEDVVKDVNVRFANQMATYQEVTDAENTLKETEFNYLQALYAYLLTELEWRKANGTL